MNCLRSSFAALTPVVYLVARVRARSTLHDRVAALAHELRHATEIGAAPTPVRTSADLPRLYRAIGFACGPGRFDSRAAHVSEIAVRRELDRGATRPRP